MTRFITRSLLILFLVSIVVVVLWSVVNVRSRVADGNALVRPSKATTLLEGPLNENGDVAYLEALNLELAQRVTPEDNAMVKIVQGLGGIAEGARLPPEFFERLGVEPPSEEGRYVSFVEWLDLNGRTGTGSQNLEMYRAQWEFAGTAPWSENEFPELAQWLDEMEQPAELFRQASLNSKYYHPLIVPAESPQRIISVQLNVVQSMREIARLQSARAMRDLKTGDVDSAFENILTMYRIGMLVRQGGTLIEDLVGFAIQGIADNNVAVMCKSGIPTLNQLQEFLAELDRLPPSIPFAQSLDSGERYMMLDVIVSVGRDGSKVLNDVHGSVGSDGSVWGSMFDLALNTVDWETCLEVSNGFYDRLIEAARIEDFQERELAIEALESELMDMQRNLQSPGGIAKTVISGRRAKGKRFAEFLLSLLVPAVQQVSLAESRSATILERTRILVALAMFKADKGHFPESLDQLIPEYSRSVPLDRFTQQPFQYGVEKNELGEEVLRLYSIGADGVDDDGANRFNDVNGEASGDDWAVDWNIPTWKEFQTEKGLLKEQSVDESDPSSDAIEDLQSAIIK